MARRHRESRDHKQGERAHDVEEGHQEQGAHHEHQRAGQAQGGDADRLKDLVNDNDAGVHGAANNDARMDSIYDRVLMDENGNLYDPDKPRNSNENIYSNVGLVDRNGALTRPDNMPGQVWRPVAHDSANKPIYGFDQNAQPIYDSHFGYSVMPGAPAHQEHQDELREDTQEDAANQLGDVPLQPMSREVGRQLADVDHPRRAKDVQDGSKSITKLCGVRVTKGRALVALIVLLVVAFVVVVLGVTGTFSKTRTAVGRKKYVAKDGSLALPFATDPALEVGETVSYSISTDASKGTTSEENGSWKYAPNQGFAGTDSVKYTATVGDNTTAAAEISIVVFEAAAIAGTEVTVGESVELTLAAHPAPAEAAVQTVAVVSAVTNGSLVPKAGATNVFIYTPTSVGKDSFSYTVKVDDSGASPATSVDIKINAVVPGVPAKTTYPAKAFSADVPVSSASTLTLATQTALPTGNLATFSVVTKPTGGTVSITGDQATYTPNSGEIGADTFSFSATVDGVTGAPATVIITRFRAKRQSVGVAAHTDALVTLAVEPPLDETTVITYAVTENPTDGKLTLVGDQVTYVPNLKKVMEAPDTFTFTATVDGRTTKPVTVTLTGVPKFDWSQVKADPTTLIEHYRQCIDDLKAKPKDEFWNDLTNEVKNGSGICVDTQGLQISQMPLDVQHMVVSYLRDLVGPSATDPEDGESGFLTQHRGRSKMLAANNLPRSLAGTTVAPDTLPLFESAKNLTGLNGAEVPRYFKLRSLALILKEFEETLGT